MKYLFWEKNISDCIIFSEIKVIKIVGAANINF